MYPGPDHFLSRPGTKDGKPGPIVPLIAVDQLPDWMQLMGVPRELDTEQTAGLTNLGIIDREDDDTYEVHLHHDKIRAILNETEKLAPSSSSGREAKAKNTDITKPASSQAKTMSESSKKDAQVTTNLPSLPGPNVTAQCQTSSSSQGEQDGNNGEHGTTSSPSSASVHEESTARPQKQQSPHPAERMLSASRHNTVDNTVAGPAGRSEKPIRPHMTQAMRDKPRPTVVQRATAKGKSRAAKGQNNIICRHWCRHGTCMWGLACRNQHRMPTTLEGLREIGLEGYPAWYLLLMGGAGGRSPSMAAHPGFDLNDLNGELGMRNHPGGTAVAPPPQYLAATTPAHALTPHQPPAAHQPSAADLRLISALLAGPGAASSRQAKEASDALLRGSTGRAQAQSYSSTHHAYANLHTNASVAANAATIRRQAERQQQQQQGRLSRRGRQQQHMHMSDLPVAPRAARVRAAGVGGGTNDDVDDVGPEDSASRAGRDSAVAGVGDEGESLVDRRDGDGGGQSAERASKAATADPEEELMDL